MRAGKLDSTIIFEKSSTDIDDNGTPVQEWQACHTVRAEIIQESTEEFVRGFGASDEVRTVFRIRWLRDLTLAYRIRHGGRIHNIKEIKELGRRRGLELRCVASGGSQ